MSILVYLCVFILFMLILFVFILFSLSFYMGTTDCTVLAIMQSVHVIVLFCLLCTNKFFSMHTGSR